MLRYAEGGIGLKDTDVLHRYFKNGVLMTMPSKQSAKLLVMAEIVNRFDEAKVYTEREINELLKPVYADFALIRRYLIDFKLLSRSKDGKEYWVTKQ